jgi:hypothetical protein
MTSNVASPEADPDAATKIERGFDVVRAPHGWLSAVQRQLPPTAVAIGNLAD